MRDSGILFKPEKHVTQRRCQVTTNDMSLRLCVAVGLPDTVDASIVSRVLSIQLFLLIESWSENSENTASIVVRFFRLLLFEAAHSSATHCRPC